jgi:hypothetical protein
VDDHEIAWAAGFFDAEGTASSSQRLHRPSRERQMAVYQGGRDEVPEALLRFQRAVGGRGNITGPYRNRLFHWTTRKNTAFDEVMTMLWPYLSEWKRAQLQRATESAGRAMPLECGAVVGSELQRTTELAWVAGFFDGEGYIGSGGSQGKRTIEMSIAQASVGELPLTLTRVAIVLGVGNLRGPRMLPNAWSKLPQYVWKAAAFEDVQYATAMLWRWLGPVKRAQARAALLRYRRCGEPRRGTSGGLSR